ncbi:MAG: VWA domain-containing protein [Planctomycetota bacterium]|jgi:hypothetical protein|nr:VWA domain-containing protein [Planctomycetota bacterium]
MLNSPILILTLSAALLAPAMPAAATTQSGVSSTSGRGSSSRLLRSSRRDLKSLQSQEKRLRTSRVAFDHEREAIIRGLLENIARAKPPDPEYPRDLEATLLSLLGTALDQGDRKPEAIERWERLAKMAEGALKKGLLRADLTRLREDILLSERADSPLRAAVARLLVGETSGRSTMALLATSRMASELVANTCRASLVGRRDEAVHAYFVRLLEPQGKSPLVDPRLAARAEAHFAIIPLAEDSPSAARLADWVARHLMSQSWREACRAVSFSACLTDEAIVPALIEALGLWQGRQDSGLAVRRTMHEIASALKDRSGRNIGTDPRRWQVWWRGVQNGTVTRRANAGSPAEATSAGFFGIRPNSDRIVFIIDASGSMDTAFTGGTGTGTSSHTRFDEAINQLESCLKLLGPKTHFNVVLFNSGSRSWKQKLTTATNSHIQGAKTWLRHHPPGGGTGLRLGVQEALHMSTWGDLDIKRLEADTVVILCDGATDSGPGWVDPFLLHLNSKARLLFHAVRIGGSGDGTLQALAWGSGGRCVDVDG